MGLKFRVKQPGGGYTTLKSDQNGIEMKKVCVGGCSGPGLKSDQNGIEMWDILYRFSYIYLLKSDQNGIEILLRVEKKVLV